MSRSSFISKACVEADGPLVLRRQNSLPYHVHGVQASSLLGLCLDDLDKTAGF